MSIHYNLTGSARKELVETISNITGYEAVYKGTPTFAYTVGDYIIDKNGTVSRHDGFNLDETDWLIIILKECGYRGGFPDCADTADYHELVIEVPNDGFSDNALENLRKIIDSKANLIEKAFGVHEHPFNHNLRLDVKEDKLRLSWRSLRLLIDGELDTYSRLFCAICNMAKRQKRVFVKRGDVENDKLTMRLFLVRLGFIGPKYKPVRKILLRKLKGNSAWKCGHRPIRAAENVNNGAENESGGKTLRRCSTL